VNAAMRISAVITMAASCIFAPPSEADDGWGRNPFAFGHASQTAAGNGTTHAKPVSSALAVEMVLIHDGKALAVVNGRKVAVNDVVDGAVVCGIWMDSVSFVKNGKTVVRRVGEDSDEAH